MHHRSPSNPLRTSAAHVALVALVALVPFVLACGPDTTPTGGPGSGGPAPEFRLATLDGGELGPQDFPDQVVLLEFWATWCIPCHAQADVLEVLYSEYRDRGVQFLAVATGEGEEVVRRFVADEPFPYPVLLDPDDEISYELGVVALPTMMVIDRAGEVVYFDAGVLDEDEVRDLLDSAGAAESA